MAAQLLQRVAKAGVGIGGSLEGADVTIKGGSVTATGGFYSENPKRADGIGAGPWVKTRERLQLFRREAAI